MFLQRVCFGMELFVLMPFVWNECLAAKEAVCRIVCQMRCSVTASLNGIRRAELLLMMIVLARIQASRASLVCHK